MGILRFFFEEGDVGRSLGRSVTPSDGPSFWSLDRTTIRYRLAEAFQVVSGIKTGHGDESHRSGLVEGVWLRVLKPGSARIRVRGLFGVYGSFDVIVIIFNVHTPTILAGGSRTN